MSGVLDYLSRLLGSVAFWIIVLPWQQGLRVRAGRHVRRLDAGVYLRVPILDVVRVETVRRRTSLVPSQTLSTADGATVTVAAVIGYAIGDVEQLFRSLTHAEDVIIQTVQGALATQVFQTPRAELAPAALGKLITDQVAGSLRESGLIDVSVTITDFAFLRAFRLIQDSRWSHGRVLDTQDAARIGGGQ